MIYFSNKAKLKKTMPLSGKLIPFLAAILSSTGEEVLYPTLLDPRWLSQACKLEPVGPV